MCAADTLRERLASICTCLPAIQAPDSPSLPYLSQNLCHLLVSAPGPVAQHVSVVQVSRNKLVVKYTGPGRHGNDVGSIQGNFPVPKQRVVYYFELLVKEKGDTGDVSIGFADKHFKMGRAPGYAPQQRSFQPAMVRCADPLLLILSQGRLHMEHFQGNLHIAPWSVEAQPPVPISCHLA